MAELCLWNPVVRRIIHAEEECNRKKIAIFIAPDACFICGQLPQLYCVQSCCDAITCYACVVILARAVGGTQEKKSMRCPVCGKMVHQIIAGRAPTRSAHERKQLLRNTKTIQVEPFIEKCRLEYEAFSDEQRTICKKFIGMYNTMIIVRLTHEGRARAARLRRDRHFIVHASGTPEEREPSVADILEENFNLTFCLPRTVSVPPAADGRVDDRADGRADGQVGGPKGGLAGGRMEGRADERDDSSAGRRESGRACGRENSRADSRNDGRVDGGNNGRTGGRKDGRASELADGQAGEPEDGRAGEPEDGPTSWRKNGRAFMLKDGQSGVEEDDRVGWRKAGRDSGRKDGWAVGWEDGQAGRRKDGRTSGRKDVRISGRKDGQTGWYDDGPWQSGKGEADRRPGVEKSNDRFVGTRGHQLAKTVDGMEESPAANNKSVQSQTCEASGQLSIRKGRKMEIDRGDSRLKNNRSVRGETSEASALMATSGNRYVVPEGKNLAHEDKNLAPAVENLEHKEENLGSKEENVGSKDVSLASEEDTRTLERLSLALQKKNRLTEDDNRAPADFNYGPADFNYGPEDDDRAPGDDNRAPEDDNRAPECDDRAPEDDNRAPECDDRAPEDDNRAPEDDNRAPEDGDNESTDGKLGCGCDRLFGDTSKSASLNDVERFLGHSLECRISSFEALSSVLKTNGSRPAYARAATVMLQLALLEHFRLFPNDIIVQNDELRFNSSLHD